VVIVLGFFFGVFTATEAGALVAAYAVAAALLYYRNVTVREMWTLLYETALLTAAGIFLLAGPSVLHPYGDAWRPRRSWWGPCGRSTARRGSSWWPCPCS